MIKAIELKRNKIITSIGLPKSFKGVYNYDKKFSEEEYHEHGWRDLVIPEINKTTQRLGKLKKVLDEQTGELLNYTYTVVDLIGDEITLATKKIERTDEAAIFFDTRIKKGEQAFLDYCYRVFRKVKNSTITKPKAIAVLKFFYESIIPLKEGLYEIALERVEGLTTSNQGLLEEKAFIIAKINQLINNEN